MKKLTTKDLALVGLWAAIIFVATLLIKFDITTPTGPVMIKSSNALCLLAGIFLGKTYGGFAAGIGSMFFDLTNPLYIASAPFTFAFFFIMAFVAGFMFEKLSGKSALFLSCLTGALSYTVLYFSKSVISTVLVGSAFYPAVIANLPKLGTSVFNVCISLILSTLFYPVFKRIFKTSGIDYSNLKSPKN